MSGNRQPKQHHAILGNHREALERSRLELGMRFGAQSGRVLTLVLWIVFTALAAISLAYFFRGRNAVWGGLVLGALVGLCLRTVYLSRISGFDWTIVGKAAIIGVLLGTLVELITRSRGLR